MIIFTCLVVYICNVPIVCRNMELRINNKSRLIEVCIDDQWYEATSSTTAASNSRSHSPQDISIQVDSTSNSVKITWSEQSIPNDKIISGYDLSCTASALSDGQIHEVKVPNVSASTTRVQVGRTPTRHSVRVLCLCTHTDQHTT